MEGLGTRASKEQRREGGSKRGTEFELELEQRTLCVVRKTPAPGPLSWLLFGHGACDHC